MGTISCACVNLHLVWQTFNSVEWLQCTQTLPTQERRDSRTAGPGLWCSTPLFVYPQGFIYSRGSDTLGRGGDGNGSCWWTKPRSAASPCLGSTWRICRRTGPPYWPGTDWHMSGEGGVRKGGGKVTELLVSVIQCPLFLPPRQMNRKHLPQCSLPTWTSPTPQGHGQLECLPQYLLSNPGEQSENKQP